jgi:ribosomal protein L10
MLNLKKKILNYKIKKIIKKYPYVLFIQFNNVTPKKWRLIKDQLYKLGIMKTLRVKNQVARKILKNPDYKRNFIANSTVTRLYPSTKDKTLSINEIFQGPTLMLGCPIVEQLPGISLILEENANLLFLGGLFENQVITHLDFKKIINLDSSVFTNLIQQCSSPMDSIFFIKSLMDLRCFNSVQKSLLQTLNVHKEIVHKNS